MRVWKTSGTRLRLAQRQLTFAGTLKPLENEQAFRSFLRPLFRQNWVVYAKPPFGAPHHVLGYLARYTHRVAITNQRLLAFEHDRVAFRWKDYAHGNKKRKMTLSSQEFLRRFLLHVLPRGFVRIRTFGFLANRRRAKLLPLCQHLLFDNPQPHAPAFTVSPRRQHLGLYYQLYFDNIGQDEVCLFLRELLRHLRGSVSVLLDNSSTHQGAPLQQLLRQHSRLHIEHFPSYAPELNPDEGFGLWRNVHSPIVARMMRRSWSSTSSAPSTVFVSQRRNYAAAYCNPACLLFALAYCILYADINNPPIRSDPPTNRISPIRSRILAAESRCLDKCPLATKVGWHERQQSCSVSRSFRHRNHRRVALAYGTSTGELGSVSRMA